MTESAAHRAHPTPRMYWLIALFLGAVTAVEITVPNVSSLDSVKVPLLWALAGLKFFTVVGFFMHLRYDKKLYRTLFLLGVIGVFPLFIVMLLSMNAL